MLTILFTMRRKHGIINHKQAAEEAANAYSQQFVHADEKSALLNKRRS